MAEPLGALLPTLLPASELVDPESTKSHSIVYALYTVGLVLGPCTFYEGVRRKWAFSRPHFGNRVAAAVIGTSLSVGGIYALATDDLGYVATLAGPWALWLAHGNWTSRESAAPWTPVGAVAIGFLPYLLFTEVGSIATIVLWSLVGACSLAALSVAFLGRPSSLIPPLWLGPDPPPRSYILADLVDSIVWVLGVGAAMVLAVWLLGVFDPPPGTPVRVGGGLALLAVAGAYVVRTRRRKARRKRARARSGANEKPIAARRSRRGGRRATDP